MNKFAIACKNPDEVKKWLNAILGVDEWHEDLVVAEGQVHPHQRPLDKHKNKAELNFNYQLGQFEFELIHYKAGRNWLQDINTQEDNFLSHLGFHIDDPKRFEAVYKELKEHFNIAQEVVTESHTNEAIKDERRYRYVIFNSRNMLGFDLKIIQRLGLAGEPFVKSIQQQLDDLEKEMIALEKQQDELELKMVVLEKQMEESICV